MAEETPQANPITLSRDAGLITVASSLLSDDIPVRRQRKDQSFLLIWIDTSIDRSIKDDQNTVAQLENILNDVNIFTEANAAIDFLTEFDDIKTFLIVDGTISQQLIPLIHDIPQLYIVYIFSDSQTPFEHWTKEWIKIKGVHTDIQPVCEALQLAINQYNQDFIAMSFVSTDQITPTFNINQLEASFMYTQLFKEILLNIEYSQQAVNDFTNYCRKNDCGSAITINRFENEYSHESVIWWYTFPSFIYSMLNCALRTLDVEAIINMGFFIHDLHQKIQDLYQVQVNSDYRRTFTVYRGQGLLKSDFEKLLKTTGGLISFNNFLSTSRTLEAALVFAESALGNPGTIGIIFMMTVDPSVSSVPFASIRDDSYFEAEDEILFSMHTIFRVGEIRKDNNIYQVDLQLTADDDEELRTLTDRMRQEIADESGWQRLGTLLLKLNEFNKAEELYTILLQSTTDQSEEALYYNQLGAAKYHRGDYKNALEYYKKALEIDRKILDQDHPSLTSSYNNIGALYITMGEYSEALSYYEKTLEIYQKTLQASKPGLAISYNNIGLVYKNIGEYSKALLYYKKALEIWQKILPVNHPQLGNSYNNIGEVYMNISEYSAALSYFGKAVEIWQKSLPSNHPLLATSYNNIGALYMEMGEHSRALSYYEKALKICQKTLPPYHPELAHFYNNIGALYVEMSEHPKALLNLEKALEIDQKTLPSNHPNLTTSYNNIGEVYMNMGEYSTALAYYEKALEIDQKTLPSNHPFLATSYNNIGEIYRNMADCPTALSYHEKALEIFEKAVPINHLHLATAYYNIGLVYIDMSEYSKALQYFERSLNIKQSSLSPNHPEVKSIKDLIDIVKKKMEVI